MCQLGTQLPIRFLPFFPSVIESDNGNKALINNARTESQTLMFSIPWLLVFFDQHYSVSGGSVVVVNPLQRAGISGMSFVLTARKVSMAKGIVKWFSNAKGYGFIAPEEGGDDIFAHFSAIDMEGYKSLRQGQKVLYEVSQGPKGLLAASINLDGSEAATDSTSSRGPETDSKN